MGSKQLLETMGDDSGCYEPEVLESLWSAIPRQFRTVELVSTGLSGEDMAVFSLNTRVQGFRLRFGLVTNVEQFSMFMHDHRESAARALEEPGWLRLGPRHAKLWRRGETRRRTVSPERREVIDNTAFSQIMANLHLIGAPIEEGGFADEQAMRIVMLVARTGRRVSEIRMLDRQPLLPLDRLTVPADDDGEGFVAKLRYQQTKIDGAPDTMLVDAEIAAIIGEQQWLAGRSREQDALGRIIIRIEQTRLADGSVHALRGAGVTARTDAITTGMDGSHHGAR